jgi:hypothetical protein
MKKILFTFVAILMLCVPFAQAQDRGRHHRRNHSVQRHHHHHHHHGAWGRPHYDCRRHHHYHYHDYRYKPYRGSDIDRNLRRFEYGIGLAHGVLDLYDRIRTPDVVVVPQTTPTVVIEKEPVIIERQPSIIIEERPIIIRRW